MIDLEAIRARDESDRKAYPGNLSVSELDRSALLAYVDELRSQLDEAEQEYQDARVVRQQLEARLAEATALLREARYEVMNDRDGIAMAERIDAYLSRKEGET